MVRVLFVCLGNICRSPLGEGIFRHHAEQAGLSAHFEIDSAGTGDWHVGEPPHEGSQRVARARGLDISRQRARQLRPDDLATFDYVVAMDSQNLRDILALDPDGAWHHRAFRLLDVVPHRGLVDVPDPYFGEAEGFDRVYDLIEEAILALLVRIRAERKLGAF